MAKCTRAYAVRLDRIHSEQHHDVTRTVQVRVVVRVEDYDDGSRDITEAWIAERSVEHRRAGARSGVVVEEKFAPPEDTDLSAVEETRVRLAVALFVAGGVDLRGCVTELHWWEHGCRACSGEGGHKEMDEDGPHWCRCEECDGEGYVMVPEEVWSA